METILLAAGFSTRMKRWKPALPFAGSTVIESCVVSAGAVSSRIIVVGGERWRELRDIFAAQEACNGKNASGKFSVVVVRNPDPARGMFSSIRIGVTHLREDRFFLALADMPLVKPETYRLLAGCLEDMDLQNRANPRYAVIPRFKGEPGHPVLLSQEHKTAIVNGDTDNSTMRDIIGEGEIVYVDVDDEGTVVDFDVPEDYRRFSR